MIHRLEDIPAKVGSRGLVPTMGALHEGHLSLIRTAKSENDEVAVSVFVNPTQFGPNEDYERYPRRLEQDAELAASAGADWVFAPPPDAMYPRRTTAVVVTGVTGTYEGALRPGHFDGVATVVLKLFNIVQPTRAYFGNKDLQQCQVVRRMVEDLNMSVALRFCETVRESDGLAMSSRNAYLSPEERQVAPNIYKELRRLQTVLREDLDGHRVGLELMASRKALEASGFVMDYLDLVDLATMTATSVLSNECSVVFAGRVGRTRLIDNIAIRPR